MMFRLYFISLLLTSLSFSFPLVRLGNIHKRGVPDFVRQYAPVAYLCSTEVYFPSDIGAQIAHTHPEDGSGLAIGPPAALTLSNLDTLNAFADGGTNVYLSSDEGIQALPSWFTGSRPQADGSTPSIVGCTVVTVAKSNDTLDAFYFYFYAYNQGNWVLGSPAFEFGDHVGDWEHTMVRFVDGAPTAVYYSQHSGGEAFTYEATQKGPDGVRPIVYVANGTHANYAIPGPHDHTLPGLNTAAGPLTDHTDQGVLWDPVADAYVYSFDNATGLFEAYNAIDPVGWLNFAGRWGDDQLPDDTPGQINVFGERKYVAGPTGPRDKGLGRTGVCPDGKSCNVRNVLVP